MKGPLYNAASHAQLQAHSMTHNAIRSALARLAGNPSLQNNTPLRVQDLGCGPGSNAIAFGENVLSQLRKEFGNQLPVRWNFVDLPSNDWSALLQLVSESAALSSSEANVFAYACGTDFYGPCSPPESGMNNKYLRTIPKAYYSFIICHQTCPWVVEHVCAPFILI